MNKHSIPPQRGFFPQPVYIVGALASNGQPNFTLITWLTFCSVTPQLLMFASRGEKRRLLCHQQVASIHR